MTKPLSIPERRLIWVLLRKGRERPTPASRDTIKSLLRRGLFVWVADTGYVLKEREARRALIVRRSA